MPSRGSTRELPFPCPATPHWTPDRTMVIDGQSSLRSVHNIASSALDPIRLENAPRGGIDTDWSRAPYTARVRSAEFLIRCSGDLFSQRDCAVIGRDALIGSRVGKHPVPTTQCTSHGIASHLRPCLDGCGLRPARARTGNVGRPFLLTPRPSHITPIVAEHLDSHAETDFALSSFLQRASIHPKACLWLKDRAEVFYLDRAAPMAV